MQDATAMEIANDALDPSLAEETEPGIWRTPVPTPFGARRANVYLLSGARSAGGAKDWTLVDCPLATRAAEEALLATLDRAGARPEDIGAIVLTHGHPDHLGAAGLWQQRCGAPVYALAHEAHLIATLWMDGSNQAFLEAAQALMAHGTPPDEAQTLVTRAVQVRRLLAPPEAPRMLAHGQRLHLGGRLYTTIWTPGHSDGHLCLLRDDGALLAGDAMLPALTPTVGWYPWSRPDPLGDQLATVAMLRDLPARLVLPGHGRPFTALPERADALAGVYARELVTVARLLAEHEAGMTAYELASSLYSARWRVRDSRLAAMAEAVARLERLRRLGRARRVEDGEGLLRYVRAHEEEMGSQAS